MMEHDLTSNLYTTKGFIICILGEMRRLFGFICNNSVLFVEYFRMS